MKSDWGGVKKGGRAELRLLIFIKWNWSKYMPKTFIVLEESKKKHSSCDSNETHNRLALKQPLKPVWLNSWVFVYELNGCGFESRWYHLNSRYRASFEQGVPWYSGNYRAWIHSETHTWYDNDIQSYLSCFNKVYANPFFHFQNYHYQNYDL